MRKAVSQSKLTAKGSVHSRTRKAVSQGKLTTKGSVQSRASKAVSQSKLTAKGSVQSRARKAVSQGKLTTHVLPSVSSRSCACVCVCVSLGRLYTSCRPSLPESSRTWTCPSLAGVPVGFVRARPGCPPVVRCPPSASAACPPPPSDHCKIGKVDPSVRPAVRPSV